MVPELNLTKGISVVSNGIGLMMEIQRRKCLRFTRDFQEKTG